ncbi:14274_t:CDS:2, partial [Dentiscutata erythropus]
MGNLKSHLRQLDKILPPEEDNNNQLAKTLLGVLTNNAASIIKSMDQIAVEHI